MRLDEKVQEKPTPEGSSLLLHEAVLVLFFFFFFFYPILCAFVAWRIGHPLARVVFLPALGRIVSQPFSIHPTDPGTREGINVGTTRE